MAGSGPQPRARPTPTVRRPDLRAVALTLLLAIGAPAVQSAAPSTANADVSSGSGLDRDDVAASIARIEGAPELSEEARERLTGQYRRVLDNLAALAEAKGALADLRETLAEAPGQTAAIRARLSADTPLAEEPLDLPAGTDPAAVQSMLAREAAAAAALEDRLTALEQGLEETRDALPLWRRELAELRQRTLDLDDELAGALAIGSDGLEARARRWLLESQRSLLQVETQVLEQRLAGADARRELALAQRDEARLALDRALARQARLQAEEERLRRAESERVLVATEAAKAAAADAHPRVRELAQANAALAEAIGVINHGTEEAEAARAETLSATTVLTQDLANDRQRIAAAGLNQALGRVLLDQRDRLPDTRELRRQAAERANATAEATLAILSWREELLALDNGEATRTAADTQPAEPGAGTTLKRQLDEQVARRIDLLERAITGGERQLRALAELDLAADKLHALALEYREFLAEHLLWMRSHVPITQQSFAALPEIIGDLIRPSNWLLVLQTLGTGIAGTWILWLGLLAVALLLAVDRGLRRRIRATAAPLLRASTDRFGYTLRAIGLTLVLAAPAPLLLAVLGLVLIDTATSNPFPYRVGDALLLIAPGLYYLRAFRLLCMKGGLAERHFRWRSKTIQGLARALDTAIWVLIPLGFIAALVGPLGEVQAATLGRLALTAVTLGSAILLAISLHPRRGVVRDALADAPEGLAEKLRYLWYPLAISVPLAAAVLTLAGFQYTAATLFYVWFEQFWLLLGLVVLHQSIVRWLLVTRRQLALRQAAERRNRREAQQKAEAESGEGGMSPKPDSDPAADDQPVDLVALDSETRKLLNALIAVGAGVGLWILWSDVLPALNVLERITLWSTGTTVDGVARSLPITLADLASILVIVTVTVIAVRHLPALLEILLLKNTGISAGGRYTIIALSGYAMTAVAVLMIAGRLGLSWQQIQWLVAALGVGIGFGLQEIVANFISGLIILFERPVRVGDTVTIGEQSGVVTRIEIRATTIRTWDQRELLVPNKELITGEVINWTLSDQINRGEILVSIEYGSDTETALRILDAVVSEDPRVMTDPAPTVMVHAFGERGLDLMVRFFLPAMADRMLIRGEIINAIDNRLRAAGIPIGLPRRDIRLRDGAADDHGPSADAVRPGDAPGSAAPGHP
ncbi:potassium efflux system protein [Thiocapsa roseopersicina]|uniref:Potassium efflux system protein n=2 Tax=Thiocapsa roseopersicina TaxID=1058 RepID=A0A1H2SLY5_THIRO|nr:potassium efflux system protein [Thiocapsa roseopersicina]